jgi:hypothetical protein
MKYLKINAETTLKETLKLLLKDFKPKNIFEDYDIKEKKIFLYLEVTKKKEEKFYLKYNYFIDQVLNKKEFIKLNISDIDLINYLKEEIY